MPSTAQFIAFTSVIGLGAMSPGPDFAVVVQQSVLAGRRIGVKTVLGVATGVFAWVLAASTGVAALLATSTAAFTAVKVGGVGYLLFLGLRGLRAAAFPAPGRDGAATGSVVRHRAITGWTAFRSGLLCNILNPKAAIFFIALIPQFLPHQPGVGDVLLLAVVALLVTIVWFGTVVTISGGLRRLLARPAVRRAIEGVTGLALVLFGIRLAITPI
jgi:threonine/homoserine/homoserine lactone efflux protein